MKKMLFWDIFNKYLVLILVSVMVLSSFLYFSLRDFFFSQAKSELQDTLKILMNVFRNTENRDAGSIKDFCTAVGAGTFTRITYILPDGTVVGDSEEDPALMDNHGNRPEVYKALKGQQGESIRYSHTLKKNMLYLALPVYALNIETGADTLAGIMRVSRLVQGLESQLLPFNLKALLAGIIILSLTILASFLIARKIDRPVIRLQEAARQYAGGNFETKTHIEAPEEIRTLGNAMNFMAEQLAMRINVIDTQKNKLAAILDHMVEPVILLDVDLLIKEMNHAACVLFRVDPGTVPGHSLIEVIRNIELYDFSREALSGRAVSEIEIMLNETGEIYLQVHATPLLGSEQESEGLLLVMNDITRLIKLENIRKDFVANVSHELKTPITAIQGFVETLREGALANPEKAAGFLEIVHRQTRRLDSIINDLLNLSRLEAAEKSGIEKIETLLSGVVENTINNCQPEAKKKQIAIQAGGEKTLRIPADSVLVEQAVTNLVDNALKYSRTGSCVEILYGKSAAKPGFAEIIVKDQGMGIPSRALPHIFERFYRVDKARSRELGGTGLGLSIVKHIALAHNGEISVESIPGTGSTFTLYLPLG